MNANVRCTCDSPNHDYGTHTRISKADATTFNIYYNRFASLFISNLHKTYAFLCRRHRQNDTNSRREHFNRYYFRCGEHIQWIFVHIRTHNGYTFGAISFAFISFINLIEKLQFRSGKIDGKLAELTFNLGF